MSAPKPKVHMIDRIWRDKVFLMCRKPTADAAKATHNMDEVTCKSCLVVICKNHENLYLSGIPVISPDQYDLLKERVKDGIAGS